MVRGFLAFEAHEELQQEIPSGRDIAPSMRHMTLVFFQEVDLQKICADLEGLSAFPLLGFGGVADGLILLPERHPRVLAWKVDFGPVYGSLELLQKTLMTWCVTRGHLPRLDPRPFLPHVTVARSPFHHLDRIKSVLPVPIQFSSLQLYESVGNLNYVKRWSKNLIPPYKEIEHTADVAYEVAGLSLDELYWNASLALATRWPKLVPHMPFTIDSQEALIRKLNQNISVADAEVGLSLKAVSYHGNLRKEGSIYYWEMIVDV